MNDPAWAWLRPLSSLIAEVDHELASTHGELRTLLKTLPDELPTNPSACTHLTSERCAANTTGERNEASQLQPPRVHRHDSVGHRRRHCPAPPSERSDYRGWRTRLNRSQRERLHRRCPIAARRGLCDPRRSLRCSRGERRDRFACQQGRAGLRRTGHDDRPRLHRLSQPSRRNAAVRSCCRQPLRRGVRHGRSSWQESRAIRRILPVGRSTATRTAT